MARRFALLSIICVVLANAAAVLLYSGAGPIDANAIAGVGAWNPILKSIAHVLTLPVRSSEISEIRDVVPIAFLGIALLLIAAEQLSSRDMRDRGNLEQNGATRLFDNPAERWLWTTSIAVVTIAILSAIANDTLALSWGWIVRFAAGAGWAILIARTFGIKKIQSTLNGMLLVGLVCLVLTLAHRVDRHLAHFTWPIGPITPTAAMAALWAAMAGAAIAVRVIHRRLGFGTVLFIAALLTALYVLQQTMRRGPVLGLVAAAMLTVALLAWKAKRQRLIRIALPIVMGLAILVAVGYVIGQSRSSNPESSGSLALRFEYWKLSGSLISQQPSLGFGPDMFFVPMTNAVSPLRAASPHFYHGNINLYAHNEWIQTAVELGIPCALFYLAIPIGILFMAWRRFCGVGELPQNRCSDIQGTPSVLTLRVAIASLIAGLITILVAESAGIMLRTPTLPIWYWTILGLLAAACREKSIVHRLETGATGSIQKAARWRLSKPIRIMSLVALAMCCFLVSFLDMSHALAKTDPFAPLDRRSRARLYASKTINALQQDAVFLSALSSIRPNESSKLDALERWRALYQRIPGWRDTPARFAMALAAAGRVEPARRVLKDAISARLNPFEPAANLQYAKLRVEDPAEQLRCVQRALRNSDWNDDLRSFLSELMSQPIAQSTLHDALPAARSIARSHSTGDPMDCSVEWLRINACLMFQASELNEAIADQRLAGEYYAYLENSNHPNRRGHDAETGVFYSLARMLYESNHANYAGAYQAIVTAERFAVLGIKHEHVARPDPGLGFVGGVVIPTEFPVRLFPLWRLSALLHVENGREQLLVARVMSFLPPESRNDEGIHDGLARIYHQASQDLSGLPADQRPAHFQTIVDQARAFSGSTSLNAGE